jgi:Domain of unknown function (DUF4278)
MKLIYRGMTYDYDTLKASSRLVRRETPYNLLYRGVSYQVTPQSETPETPVQTVNHQLIYRGNTYWVTRTIAKEATIPPTTPPEVVMHTL